MRPVFAPSIRSVATFSWMLALAVVCVGGATRPTRGADAKTPTSHSENLLADATSPVVDGELPAGWEVVAPNPAIAPAFETCQLPEDGVGISATGAGREECYGYIRRPVTLEKGKTYRFTVRLVVDGLEDLHRHLVHSVHAEGFNDGVFEYRTEGDEIVGERCFAGPQETTTGEVRLCFRFSAAGKVQWREVSLVECEPIPPRPVKIAVSWGWGDREQWSQFLDAAGEAGADIALLPEFCNCPDSKSADGLRPETIDGPTGQWMAGKAREWKMYVCGTFLRQAGDLVHNSAPLFDREGDLVGVYDKNMLYDPELNQGTTPGVGYPVFETDFGRVGVMICYDSWFPEPARLMAYRGAEVILLPNAGYYRQLMQARAADNGVVFAVSSLNCPAGVWDSGGSEAGEAEPESTRYAPQNAILDWKKDDERQMLLVTVDLSKKPSPHYWGGPMLSAPGGRRVRRTWRVPLEKEIAVEAQRW